VRSLQAERTDEGGEAVGVVGHAERLGRIRGAAGARGVPRHHRELVGELIELPTPIAAVAEASVHQDQRRPFAHPPEGDAPSLDLESNSACSTTRRPGGPTTNEPHHHRRPWPADRCRAGRGAAPGPTPAAAGPAARGSPRRAAARWSCLHPDPSSITGSAPWSTQAVRSSAAGGPPGRGSPEPGEPARPPHRPRLPT
jgi:hypothetical protein